MSLSRRSSKSKELKRLYRRVNLKRFEVFNFLIRNPCPCGQSNPVCLECHHIRPSKKTACISDMIYGYNYSISDLRKELKKCKVLCGNCHQKLELKKIRRKQKEKLST